MLKDLFKDIRLLKRMNWPVTAAVALLMMIGVVFIYSSCFVSQEQPVRMLWVKQIVWGVVGIICYVLFSLYDYRRLSRISLWLYMASICLLVLVLFTGVKIYGARRWLRLYGTLGIQPSELSKLSTLIMLAVLMSRPGVKLWQMREVGIILLIVIIPLVLILKEPDLGTGMILLPVAFAMMFVAGVPFRIIGVLAAAGLLLVMLILGAVLLPERLGVGEVGQTRILRLVGLKDYHKVRIEAFFQPEKDPLGAGWSKMQSEIAVGSGGPWGKGFNRGTQKMLGFLPRSVAPTDFIYSVIAEEKGFFGSVVALLLFGIILVGGIHTAIVAEDRMGRLLCIGVVAMIFCHVFINIAMTIGLLPITGLPLPLLSYGGSFMITTMSGLGIVQSVHMHSYPLVQSLRYSRKAGW